MSKPHLVKIIGGNEWACYTSRNTFSGKVAFGQTPLLAYFMLFGVQREMPQPKRKIDLLVRSCRHNPLGFAPECECLTSRYLPLRDIAGAGH